MTALAAHPANAPVLEFIRAHESECHPDLALRLGEVVAGLDAQPASTDGVAVVARGGVAFAFATGTSLLALRVPDDVRRDALEARGTGRAQLGDLHDLNLGLGEALGPEWVAVDPWPIDVHAHEGLRQLREWARAAYDYADSPWPRP